MRSSDAPQAQGEAAAFDKVYAQYKLAPEVTRRRMYYETMEQVLSKVDKTIVEAPGVTPYLPLPQVAEGAADRKERQQMSCGSCATRSLLGGRRLRAADPRWCGTLPDRARDQAGGRSSASASRCGSSTPIKPGGRFGRPAPASIVRMPFVEQIVWIDKRVQNVDMQRQQVLSTDQQRLEVDAFARYRIVDPLRMYIRAGSEEQLSDQLQPILGSEIRNELGKRPFASLLTPERGQIMDNIRAALEPGRQPIWRRDPRRPDQARRPARRHAARSALRPDAHRARAGGRSIRAQGSKQAQIIRAAGRCRGGQIYAASFGKDPRILRFLPGDADLRDDLRRPTARARRQGRSTIILSPDNDYLKRVPGPQMIGQPRTSRTRCCSNTVQAHHIAWSIEATALRLPPGLLEYR